MSIKPLMSTVSAELADVLAKSGRRRRYTASQQIFAEGADAAFLPIVISGSVKMLRSPDPGKEVIIGIFREGEMFALPPVFDGDPYPASAFALEDTVLIEIARRDFLKLIEDSSEFALAVISWTCGMLREKTSIIKNLAVSSPEKRVGSLIVKLAEQQGRLPVKIKARRQDLAEMANLTVETTIRAVRRLADQGLVRIEHGKIIVGDLGPLRQYLQD